MEDKTIVYYFVELNGYNHQYDYKEDALEFYEHHSRLGDYPSLYRIEKTDISY